MPSPSCQNLRGWLSERHRNSVQIKNKAMYKDCLYLTPLSIHPWFSCCSAGPSRILQFRQGWSQMWESRKQTHRQFLQIINTCDYPETNRLSFSLRTTRLTSSSSSDKMNLQDQPIDLAQPGCASTGNQDIRYSIPGSCSYSDGWLWVIIGDVRLALSVTICSEEARHLHEEGGSQTIGKKETTPSLRLPTTWTSTVRKLARLARLATTTVATSRRRPPFCCTRWWHAHSNATMSQSWSWMMISHDCRGGAKKCGKMRMRANSL